MCAKAVSPPPKSSQVIATQTEPRAHDGARLRIGYIAGAHGLKGALRFRTENPQSATLEKLSRIFLERDGAAREYRVVGAGRLSARTFRIVLDGITDADAADALRGDAVSVALEDLPPPGPGEFYYFQTIGCDVFTVAGDRVGQIAEVFSNGAHEVWVVRDDSREYLIPVIDDVVKSIDLGGRRAIIEPLPGLLE